MALSREAVAEIKQRADILQIIGERVSLTSSGGSHKGLCPFHSEKTPSFTVSPSRGMYHCFGCGAGGSVIDFIMTYERLSFGEAVTQLAHRLGIPLEGGETGPSGARDRDLLEAAKGYYANILTTSPQGETARMYLKERGFAEESWGAFSMGFALEAWQGLGDFSQSQGFSQEDQVATGLIKVSESGRAFDMLRKRVVFPIKDARGSVVGFGGRSIDPLDQPKYLNTPETRLYHKSKVLFGMAESQQALREGQPAILVEGYFDVIQLHMAGFSSAMATCGTALSADHVSLLERYAKEAVLVFDGDAAGLKAAQRSAPLFLNRGIETRVVTLPDGLDPDDFIRTHGAEAFGTLLKKSTPLMEFVVQQTLARHGNTLAGKERTLEELKPLLEQIAKPQVRDLTIRYLSDLLGVRTDLIMPRNAAPISNAHTPRRGYDQAAPPEPQSVSLISREARHQRRAMRILLGNRELLPFIRAHLRCEEMTDPEVRHLLERIFRLSDEEFFQLEDLTEFFPELSPLIRALELETSFSQLEPENLRDAMQYEIAMIKEKHKEKLFQLFKQAAGTKDAEGELQKYCQVRDEIKIMKSVSCARSLVISA